MKYYVLGPDITPPNADIVGAGPPRSGADLPILRRCEEFDTLAEAVEFARTFTTHGGYPANIIAGEVVAMSNRETSVYNPEGKEL